MCKAERVGLALTPHKRATVQYHQSCFTQNHFLTILSLVQSNLMQSNAVYSYRDDCGVVCCVLEGHVYCVLFPYVWFVVTVILC